MTFTPDEVAFTYGSKWKQRYFTQVGDDYFVLPAQWDVRNRQWRRYFPQPGGDWWTEHYPVDPMQRPTGPLCDGCHSVNYDIAAGTPTEWNVGCEACHGPGSVHNADQSAASIVNPARLDPVRADDICIQCHSQGQPRENPINGQYYDWPVGFRPGDRLNEYWELDGPHLGEETFTHWPEGSAHKNRMQGNDYVQSQMYVKGVTCYGCHDVHGTAHDAELIAPGNEVCLTCHGPQLQAGPRGSIAYHTPARPRRRGQRLCRLPHAGNRPHRRRRQRAQPPVRVHLPVADRSLRHPQPLHHLSRRPDDRLGDRGAGDLAAGVAVEGRAIAGRDRARP